MSHQGTVYVSYATARRITWRWSCGCGQARGGYMDERQCRDDGLEHQQTGKPSSAFSARTRRVPATPITAPTVGVVPEGVPCGEPGCPMCDS